MHVLRTPIPCGKFDYVLPKHLRRLIIKLMLKIQDKRILCYSIRRGNILV